MRWGMLSVRPTSPRAVAAAMAAVATSVLPLPVGVVSTTLAPDTSSMTASSCAAYSSKLKRRKLKSKAEVESITSQFSFKRLVPRQFQLGFHRVNLHRPTMPFTVVAHSVIASYIASAPTPAPPSSVNPTMTRVRLPMFDPAPLSMAWQILRLLGHVVGCRCIIETSTVNQERRARYACR